MSLNVIWLCSWYPSDTDNYIGDFVQRQAIAASQFVSIELLHVTHSDRNYSTTRQINEHLKETIIYRKRRNAISFFLDYKKQHNQFLQTYLESIPLPDLIHVHIPIKAGIIALHWKQKYKLPFVLTEHYGIYNSIVEDNFNTRSLVFKYFTRKIISSSSALLPVSNKLGEEINSVAIPTSYIAIPNVVNTKLFYFQNEKPHTPLRFIHVSNFAPLKNVDKILDAILLLVKNNFDFECILCGGTSITIQQKVNQINAIKHCVFLEPILSYEDVSDRVRNADIGILFSDYETQSCVILEFLCAGLPVIASAVGGVTELISNENGLLVESQNVQHLCQAMIAMMETYSSYNRKLISEQASSQFSYEAVGKKLLSCYKNVLELNKLQHTKVR